MASISIAIDSGLFHAIVSGGGMAKSISLLAQKTGAEASFLGKTFAFHAVDGNGTPSQHPEDNNKSTGRIARHLAAEKLILETGASEYAPAAATHILTSPAMEAMAKIM
jgi:hypothetical protein